MTKRKRQTDPYALRLHRRTGQGYVLIDGRRHYKGKFDRPESHERAKRFVAEYFANGQTIPTPLADLTVVEAVAAFRRHAGVYYRRADGTPTSELSNFNTPLRILITLYGRTPAAEFGAVALRACRAALVERGLCRGVVNSHTNRLRRVFRWAASNELVPVTVHQALMTVDGLKRGRSDARETSPVTPADDSAIAAVLGNVCAQVRAMIELQLLTGMRPGEVCSMRPIDIDASGSIWIYSPRRHKTEHHSHTRSVPLGPRAQAILTPFMTRLPECPLFSPAEAERARATRQRLARRTRVSPSQQARNDARERSPTRRYRESYTPASYRKAVRRVCERLCVTAWLSGNPVPIVIGDAKFYDLRNAGSVG